MVIKLVPSASPSTDETATENILKAELTMASLCGRLGLVTPRDAFITAICKASLPPHYALTVLNSNTSSLYSKGLPPSLSVSPSLCLSLSLPPSLPPSLSLSLYRSLSLSLG